MKKIIWVLFAIVVVGAAAYVYVFHKPHRDIQGEKATHSISAQELRIAYAENLESANALYLDQVIEVEGSVVELDGKNLKLQHGIYCVMVEGFEPSPNIEGAEIAIKGRVVGYDELFGEVKMDNCQQL